MDKQLQLRILEGVAPFFIAETNDFNKILVKREKEPVPFYLFLVTIKKKRKGRSPALYYFNVFAPDETQAISQVESLCFDEYPTEQERIDVLFEKKATRIEFYIRGWGSNTF